MQDRPKAKILVVGGKGQLGQCIRKIADNYPQFKFQFTDSTTLDITDEDAVKEYFRSYNPDFCINASAYTAVDLAESEPEKAFAVNTDGVAALAQACKSCGAWLIHISTDYVFDGDTEISYTEDNFTSPAGVYGTSKRRGEEAALENNTRTVIIRTSWLYSEFNKNFVKTMLQLFKSKDELNIVADQYGQPTNANDLAEAIMQIITAKTLVPGIFHFSNFPETSWFHFAEKIAELSGSQIKLNAIATDDYPTPAKRPMRSTMDLSKIEAVYGIEPKYWERSLEPTVAQLIMPEE